MFQTFQYRRLSLLTSVLVAAMAALEFRVIWLQWIRHEELRKKAMAFTELKRVLPPWRGEIRERTGTTLAASRPLVTICANLGLWTNRFPAVVRGIAPLLDSNEAALGSWLQANLPCRNDGTFAAKSFVLQRHVPPERWLAISNGVSQARFGFSATGLTRSQTSLLKRLRSSALFAQEEQGRIYPYGASLTPITGYIMASSNPGWPKGVSGIEGALDSVLAGQPGLCVSEQDAAGRELAFRRRQLLPAIHGNHVVLTIDLNIQQMAERSLSAAVRMHTPKNASVIVMRPRTGEVLAWACWPSLTPQGLGSSTADDWRNHALSDRYEPGSTFKIFTLAAALNEKQAALDDMIFCGNGRFATNGVTVHDHVPHGWLSVRQALAKSSNVAFAQLALRLGAEKMHRYMTNFGFGYRTGIALVSETPGYVPSLEDCGTPPTLARVGFGQGVSLSQLQLILGVCAVCNDGRLMRPMLVQRLEAPDGSLLRRFEPECVRTVISPRVARQVREALEGVLSPEGTGGSARLRGLPAGGKTGTAQKASRTGYLADCYYSSFVGFFPVDEPEVCISVALDEPRNGYYGGAVAAPVFRSLAEQVSAYLGILPDQSRLAGEPSRPEFGSEAALVESTDAEGGRTEFPQPQAMALARTSRP